MIQLNKRAGRLPIDRPLFRLRAALLCICLLRGTFNVRIHAVENIIAFLKILLQRFQSYGRTAKIDRACVDARLDGRSSAHEDLRSIDLRSAVGELDPIRQECKTLSRRIVPFHMLFQRREHSLLEHRLKIRMLHQKEILIAGSFSDHVVSGIAITIEDRFDDREIRPDHPLVCGSGAVRGTNGSRRLVRLIETVNQVRKIAERVRLCE